MTDARYITTRNSGEMCGYPGQGRDRATGHIGHASGARKYSVRLIRTRLAVYGLCRFDGHLLNAARKPPRVIKLFSTRCCRGAGVRWWRQNAVAWRGIVRCVRGQMELHGSKHKCCSHQCGETSCCGGYCAGGCWHSHCEAKCITLPGREREIPYLVRRCLFVICLATWLNITERMYFISPVL